MEITDSVLEDLQELDIREPQVVESDFISRLNHGLARCLDEDGKPFSIKSGNPYDIIFTEPVYVSMVEVFFSKQVLGAGIELSIFDPLSNRNVRRRIAQDVFSSTMQFSVSRVTSGISLLLQSTFLEMFGKRTLEVKRIKILGYLPKDFEEITASFTLLQGMRDKALQELSNEKNQLQTRYSAVQQREKEVAELEEKTREELSDLEGELSETDEAIKNAAARLTVLQEGIAASETRKQTLAEQIVNYEATSRSIEGEIVKGKEQLRGIAVETSEKETRLKNLTSNVNLFSEEFASFSDHGATQTRTFIYLSIIPLLIVAFLTAQLLVGAVDLSVKYVKEPNLDLMTIFVTRLPYLAVCGSILALCYSAIHFLFGRISIIYAERLDFAKIGILAKDVASASAHGIPLKDEQLYEARTYLKIEMLKSYLSGNVGAFVYRARDIDDQAEAEPERNERSSTSTALEGDESSEP